MRDSQSRQTKTGVMPTCYDSHQTSMQILRGVTLLMFIFRHEVMMHTVLCEFHKPQIPVISTPRADREVRVLHTTRAYARENASTRV